MSATYDNNKDIVVSPPQKEGLVDLVSDNAAALLARSMVDGCKRNTIEAAKGLAVNYTIDKKGVKQMSYTTPTEDEMKTLVDNYRNNPKDILAMARINILEIVRDHRLPEEARKERLDRYLHAYIDLSIALDHAAFPPDGPEVVHEGVPTYIPDGLSDMGGDPRVDPKTRNREKIRIDKTESYKKSFDDLKEIFWKCRDYIGDLSGAEIKFYLIDHVMSDVYREMPYDHINGGVPHEAVARSIKLNEYVKAASPMSVCRHKAMETQLRLQILGIESRLLKCDMSGEAHAANLVRVQKEWYLIDTTNPEAEEKQASKNRVEIKNYRRKIDFKNEVGESWNLDRNSVRNGTVNKVGVLYSSRNNMYYRVLQN